MGSICYTEIRFFSGWRQHKIQSLWLCTSYTFYSLKLINRLKNLRRIDLFRNVCQAPSLWGNMRGRSDNKHTVDVIEVWVSCLVNSNVLALSNIAAITFHTAGTHIWRLDNVMSNELSPKRSNHWVFSVFSCFTIISVCSCNCKG